MICLTSLSDHLEVRGDKFCLPLFLKIHCDAVSVEKDKYLRPNKKISVFRVTGLKILGREGTYIYIFFSGRNIKLYGF